LEENGDFSLYHEVAHIEEFPPSVGQWHLTLLTSTSTFQYVAVYVRTDLGFLELGELEVYGVQ